MTITKQNPLYLIFGTVVLMLLLSLGSMNASAATITKDTDSSFKDVAIAQVNSHVNIRSKASTSGKIVGKIHDNSAAIIKKKVKGEGGTWYYISSGSVKGYVKASYFVTGSSAKKVAKKTGKSTAKVNASALRLRKKASTSSSTITTLSDNTTLSVLKKNVSGENGRTFTKVKTSGSKTGYVAQDYVDFCISMKTAVKTGSTASTSSKKTSSGSSSSSSASTGSSIVATAKKYVGVLPYVWGGTSLKTGADCSGFTQAIYRLYGISIPRTSSAQASGGRSISRSKLQKGDLVFYSSNGSISHVAIYIGSGKIVHEANSRSDCKISSIDYDTPTKYVTYLH